MYPYSSLKHPPGGALNRGDILRLVDAGRRSVENVRIYTVGQLGNMTTYLVQEDARIHRSELSGIEKVIVHSEDSSLFRADDGFCLGDFGIDRTVNGHFAFEDEDKARAYSDFLREDTLHREYVAWHHERCRRMFADLGDDYGW